MTTEFRRNRALSWIEVGGTLEDAGNYWELATGRARFLRHFHDPLQPWDRAGLSLPLFIRFESSVRWAQRTNQDGVTGHGNYSWPDARRYYLTALTAESPTDREQAFADTFRALGQVMHLIVDASVPEHVRDDVHPLGPVFGNYEYWVSSQHPDRDSEQVFIGDFLSAPIGLDPALLDIPIPSGETVARLPVARLFDSDRYLGTNPEVTAGALIGIAEVANANFQSDDTRHGQYPHPARANMERYVRLYPKTGLPRAYYKMKPGFGLPVDPVAQECALNELTGLDELCVDIEVWRETARHMLPRAVGYSAGLLDYFFRGKLDFELQHDPWNPTSLGLTIWNKSAETMTGSFTLYTEDREGKRIPVLGASVEGVTLSGIGAPDAYLTNSVLLVFTPDPAVKIGGLTLVFAGTLGAEEGAVAGRVKPWEPPIFALQEVAELTGAEQVETRNWCVDIETGELCEYSSTASNTRSKDPRMQRMGGHFLALDGSVAGEHIKRVWVETGALAPAEGGIALRLNGETDVGRAWSRDAGPALVPTTWEVVIDLRQALYSLEQIGFPVLAVETESGRQWRTQFVGWWKNVSIGSAWVDFAYAVYSCNWGYVLVSSSSGTSNQAEVSFGKEFIPVGEIRGFEVGTYISAGGLPWIDDSCPSEASSSDQYVAVFADASHAPTSRAIVSQRQSLRRWVDESNRDSWAKPPGPPPGAPQLLQGLSFRRQYSPDELLWYQVLGVTPPDYEVQLR